MSATGEAVPGAGQKTSGRGNGANAGHEPIERDDSFVGRGTALRRSARGTLRNGTQRLDQALAAFSIGLGLVELLAPRRLGHLIGAGDHPALFRLCGLREIASGVALLSPKAARIGAMSRQAGDVMDLVLLGAAFASRDARPVRLALATTAVLGAAAVDAYAARRHSLTEPGATAEPVPVSVSIAIGSTPEKLYAFWRDVENLPRFMQHLQSVTRTGERTSHWAAKAPGGGVVEWDSEIIEERPNELIAWRTLPGSDVEHRGRVSFERLGEDRGSTVHVELVYDLPAGRIGAAIAKLAGEEPELQIRRDLRNLKQLLETGEVASTRGQPAGRRSLLGKVLTRSES
jgi:uncharacterized membrane protein